MRTYFAKLRHVLVKWLWILQTISDGRVLFFKMYLQKKITSEFNGSMAFTGFFLESSNFKRKMEFPDVSNFGATFFSKGLTYRRRTTILVRWR
jgi:hypothetical protein